MNPPPICSPCAAFSRRLHPRRRWPARRRRRCLSATAACYEDGGPPAALLAEGERLHIVRVGDVLDGRYRVSAVGRARVDLVYLPLNQTQSLVSGALP
jgi:hypothetical protein